MLAAGVSETTLMLGGLALEGTKQIRSTAVVPSRSVAAHFAHGEQGRGRNRLRRDETLGGDHPADVPSNAKSCRIFVRLCQTRWVVIILDIAIADSRSENGRWAGVPDEDRRNGQRVDDGNRRIRSCSGC